MRKRNIATTLFVAAAFVMTMGGCPKTGGECEGEADCDDNSHCHPFLKVCQHNCKKVDTACDDLPGTTCSEEDIIDPIEGMSFNGLCVCDPADDKCEDDEGCNPKDLQCESPCSEDSDCEGDPYPQDRVCVGEADADKFCTFGEGDGKCPGTACESPQVCDQTTGDCLDPCTAGSCEANEYCDDGRYNSTMLCIAGTPPCSDHDDCVAVGMLCDGTNCADPDTVTAAACGESGTETPAQSRSASDNAPLITAIDTTSCLDTPACGDASKVRMLLLLEVYDPDGDFSSAPVNDLHGHSYAISSDISPQQPVPTWTGTGDTRTISFPVCLDPSTTRHFYFWVDDDAGNSSNAFCTSVVVPADSSGC